MRFLVWVMVGLLIAEESLSAGEEPSGPPSAVRVIASGHGAGHFLEQDGRPVFIIGDSITQGWAEAGADLDQDAWVRALAGRGIRALHLWAFIAPQAGEDERLGYDAPEILPWVKVGPGRWDLGRHDGAYFARLRELCERARDAGLLVVIQVFDGWPKTRFASHPFSSACGGPLEDRLAFVELADYDREMPEAPDGRWGWRERNQHIQERFAARLVEATAELPNVLYELFNEGEWYDGELRRRHEAHFLAFFRSRCSNLLITNDDHIAGSGFRGDPRNDVISHHRPGWSCATRAAASFDHYRREFGTLPAKPLLFTEPVPEFGGGDACEVEGLTRLMWGTALAGAGFFVQNDTSFGFNPRARMAARAELRDRMLDREGACSRFFNDLGVGWTRMEPSPEVSSTGVAMARAGAEYVVYSEEGPAFTVDLSAGEGIPFEGRFYDPRTGRLLEAAEIRGGLARERIAKPDGRDWVFWLRRRENAIVEASHPIQRAPGGQETAPPRGEARAQQEPGEKDAARADGRSWAERLGYPPGKTVLLLHMDDVGMCYEANHVAKERLSSDRALSGSMMAPCPWFNEIAAWYREHPDVDLGLHLTLTSEWKHYRWGPVAPPQDVRSLVDADGYLPRSALDVALKVPAAEVEREIRAQLARALSRGVRPGHLDTHMGTVFARADYTAAYLKVAEEHGIPAMIMGFRPDVLDRFRKEGYPIGDAMLEVVAAYRLPKLDDLRSAPSGKTYEEKREAFCSLVRSLQPGITQIIFHPSIESEGLRRITNTWQQRVWDARLLSDPEVDAFFREEGVLFTDWKEMMRRHTKAPSDPGAERS